MPTPMRLGGTSSSAERLGLAARRGRPRDNARSTRSDRNAVPREELSVLVVDDDQDLLESLIDLLELRGFTVSAATTLRGALSQARLHRPDVALVDVKLGKDNGLELVPELKHRCPQVCALVMTAYPEAKYATLAFESGADGFLYKPLDPDALVRSLDAHLGRSD